MQDMAYHLPSVFYVKDDDERHILLYHADRKTEFENKLTGLYCICPCFVFIFIFILLLMSYLIKKFTKVQMS